MEKRVVIACGGTGGHLYPAIALAEQLEERIPGVRCIFAGHGLSHNPYFRKELLQEDVTAAPISFRPGISLPGKLLRFCIDTMQGVQEGRALLRGVKPGLVIGFGSYHTFPLLLSTASSRIPLYLFAGDAIPGKVVRFFSRWAVATGCFLPEARRALKGAVIQQYMPLRRDMRKKLSSHECKVSYGLDPDRPVLLVMGGSNGAKFLNEFMLKEVERLDPQLQILHIVGLKGDLDGVQSFYAAKRRLAKVLPFEMNMACALQAADLLLARAGASTLAELLTFQVPSVIIPYPHAADDHQKANGRYLARHDACYLHEEKEPPLNITQSLERLLKGATRDKMKKAQRNLWLELNQDELLNQIVERICS